MDYLKHNSNERHEIILSLHKPWEDRKAENQIDLLTKMNLLSGVWRNKYPELRDMNNSTKVEVFSDTVSIVKHR